MPSLQTARRIANAKTNNAKTLGQIYKEESDFLMEETWDNSITSKICYIYDFYHDDQPRLAEGMTYENTTKTRIDAKFIIKSYQSMDKDQVDYYVQFRPSQSIRFSENNELYYFETDYKTTYGNTFPIGLYLDIPDDRNIYHKWLICREEKANQFPKYLVLPCDYELCRLRQMVKIELSVECGLFFVCKAATLSGSTPIEYLQELITKIKFGFHSINSQRNSGIPIVKTLQ